MRTGNEMIAATSALLRLECHHAGAASGASAITNSSTRNGSALSSGSWAPSIVLRHDAGVGVAAYASPDFTALRDGYHPVGARRPQDVSAHSADHNSWR